MASCGNPLGPCRRLLSTLRAFRLAPERPSLAALGALALAFALVAGAADVAPGPTGRLAVEVLQATGSMGGNYMG